MITILLKSESPSAIVFRKLKGLFVMICYEKIDTVGLNAFLKQVLSSTMFLALYS